MNATKPAFNPEPMPHIASAEAIDGRRVIIEWASGPRGGISAALRRRRQLHPR